jgi:hypothetical protein
VRPRLQSALLWGAVGAMAFLTLHQGYLLAGGSFLGVGPVAAVTVAVFLAATVGTYYAEKRVGPFLSRLRENDSR